MWRLFSSNHCIMIKAIKTDHSIDFEFLDTQLDGLNPQSFYTRCCVLLNEIFQEIYYFFQTQNYIVGILKYNYFNLHKKINTDINDISKVIDQNTFSHQSKAWALFFTYINNGLYSKETLNQLINTSQQRLIHLFSDYLCSEALNKEDLLQELIRQYKARGFCND